MNDRYSNGHIYDQPAYDAPAGYRGSVYGYTPRRKGRVWAWSLGIVVSLALIVGGYFALILVSGKMLALTQVENIHKSMKKNDAATIFNLANPIYQTQMGRAHSEKMFHSIYAKLGQPVSATITDNYVNIENGIKVRYVTARTLFQGGMATEDFRFRDNEGVLTLIAYEISSHELLDTPLDGKEATPVSNVEPMPQSVTPVSRF